MLNKCQVIGRVGKDAAMQYTSDGKPFTKFSVGVSEGTKDNPRTEWFPVVCWDKLAEYANEYIKKGALVYVEGKLRTNKWTAPDGSQRSRVDVQAFQIRNLSPKPKTDEVTTDEQINEFEM